MATQPTSLKAEFDALHAERIRTWPPEQLARNVAQRRALVAAYDPAAIVPSGETLRDVVLEGSRGERIELAELAAEGPLVLIFFRFAGCPACNLALPYYDRELRPALAARGGRIVAVSPHLPEQGLDAIRVRHDLGFVVAADRGNALARRLGISFARGEVPDGQPSPGWIGELTGTGTAELPQPAVILLDADAIVQFVDVSPDWLDRTEAPAILAAVDRLDVRQAA